MTDAAGKGLFPGAAIAQNLLAWCQFCFDLTDRDDECLLRHGWCAAIRRTRKARHERTSGNHRPLPPFRAIAKQHLGGALKHLSRTAIKEAAQRVGLWSRGKLVLDSPDDMDLVLDVAAFPTRRRQSRRPHTSARPHPATPRPHHATTPPRPHSR